MQLSNKRVGETPLELIHRLYPNTTKKITYAGRLDPMAEGLMILLVGEEVHNKNEYLNLGKTYEIDILFGISTDTYDTLGLITDSQFDSQPTRTQLQEILDQYPHQFSQPYPPYSARTVEGKPLWQWAREGKLDEVSIPTKTVTISRLELTNFTTTNLSLITKKIIQDISQVTGDFRQSKIIPLWSQLPDLPITIASLTIDCSSGTYMRSLAHDIGKQLNIPALALHIKRTRIDHYNLSDV